MSFLSNRKRAHEIVGVARFGIGVMVLAGLASFHMELRVATGAMTPHAMTTTGALAFLAAFAASAALAVFAAAADVDGRTRRDYARDPSRLR